MSRQLETVIYWSYLELCKIQETIRKVQCCSVVTEGRVIHKTNIKGLTAKHLRKLNQFLVQKKRKFSAIPEIPSQVDLNFP